VKPAALQERANVGLHAHVAQRVQALLPARQACVLDLGCGSGALLQRLAALGYSNLWGLDIAPPVSAQPGLHYMTGDLDACRMPLPDGSVQLAMAVEVLEHVENTGSLLDELARVLAPDGVLLVTTPNVHSVQARLRYLLLGELKQFDAIGDPTHITPVFEFPFRRLLARHGLEVAQRWGFPEDGSSPTSRAGLSALAGALSLLGVRGSPAGDQLCLLIRKRPVQDAAAHDKRHAVTAHYA
jgi:2-polyprenyl-3-methyl-5-hydroxy-6-metoxy-1,4-benzoquinol methylase